MGGKNVAIIVTLLNPYKVQYIGSYMYLYTIY
jgi:hypothetical protein